METDYVLLFFRRFSTRYSQPLVESYPPGYPRLAALVGADPAFNIARRFSILRARLLHLKQDRLSALGKKLESIDQEEKAVLFLGASRRDKNVERQAVIADIDIALADYGMLMAARVASMMLIVARCVSSKKCTDPPFQRRPVNIVTSLRRWVSSTGDIARDETEFLDYPDLITLSTPVDCTLKDIESWIERGLVRHCGRFYKSRCNDLSDDPNIFIPSDLLTMRLARAVLGLLIIILLMVPVFVCNSVVETGPRLAVIGVSTTAFVAIMSGLTRAKSVELSVAGAA
ncbi:hypothetical protein ASPCAL02234 [Aspergillus calidoustus]|uniref:DUF6594 domain-containing protein n=1 Tax=Aspergillus calidoustus TaxID=454130 RepID=A0A0U5GLN5_ASPCI|nr:hypothetical protein ASPCAL02234 [Aspergillus calidoustus]